jgi:hypothetical protein
MYKLQRLTVVSVLIIALIVLSRRADCAQFESGFKKAYDRWQFMLDSSALSSDPFFFDATAGTKEEQDTIKELLTYGVESIPELVALMRNETNRRHLYRATMLLGQMGGGDIYLSYRENISAEVFDIRDEFLQQWDSGVFTNPDERLSKLAASMLRPLPPGQTIQPHDLRPIRYYGVYAFPFIARAIKNHNSPELYAVFLIVTRESEAYTEYIQNPGQLDSRSEHKMERFRLWYENNRERLEQVPGLSAKMRNAVEQ